MTTDKSRADALTAAIAACERLQGEYDQLGALEHAEAAGNCADAIRKLPQAVEQHEAAPCVHADDPKSCYRVRCQLGNKCVDDDMSPRQSKHEAAPAEKPFAWAWQWKLKGDTAWPDEWQMQVCKPVFPETDPYDYRIKPIFDKKYHEQATSPLEGTGNGADERAPSVASHMWMPADISDPVEVPQDFGDRKAYAFKDPKAGEHDPWYVVLPNMAALKLGYHADDAVDRAHAEFIAASINRAVSAPAPRTEVAGAVKEARDKWKIVDGDMREAGDGLITYHVDAFNEGMQLGHIPSADAAAAPDSRHSED